MPEFYVLRNELLNMEWRYNSLQEAQTALESFKGLYPANSSFRIYRYEAISENNQQLLEE